MSGLIHLYVGDGKGKTTAAAGLAMRALGCGKQVLFGQFLKGRPTGEIASLAQLGAKILRAKSGEKFIFQLSPEEKAESVRLHTQALAEIGEEIASGRFQFPRGGPSGAADGAAGSSTGYRRSGPDRTQSPRGNCKAQRLLHRVCLPQAPLSKGSSRPGRHRVLIFQ